MPSRSGPSHRLLVLEIVQAERWHPTADEVFMEARKSAPSISLATVYRNLRQLVAEGVLRERRFARVTRFDPKLEPHAHLVCSNCETITDVDLDSDGPFAAEQHARGWDIQEVDLELRGMCPQCRGGAATARPPR